MDDFGDADLDGIFNEARHPTLVLTEAADRLDSLAESAELMGDESTALGWRSKANELRLRAMTDFD